MSMTKSAELMRSEHWEITGGEALMAGTWSDAPVALAGGQIAGTPAGRSRRLDASGCLVLPGIVDLHGDAFERQISPRPGVDIPFAVAILDNDRQVVASGITTAYYGVTLSYEPGLRSSKAAEAFIAGLTLARDTLAADARVHLRYEVQEAGSAGRIGDWMAAGEIGLLSFNDHLEMQIAELERPAKRDRYLQRTGLDADSYRALLERAGGEPADRLQARLRALAAAARDNRIPVMMHDPATPDRIAEAADLGCGIAEFPLALDAAQAAQAAGMSVVMGAPNILRGGSHKGFASAAALVERGLCTVLASDYHYPAPLQAPFILAQRHAVPLERGWDLVSAGAAAAAGLDDRGTLDHDRRGDVIVVRPPGTGTEVARAVATFAGGRLVHLAEGWRLG